MLDRPSARPVPSSPPATLQASKGHLHARPSARRPPVPQPPGGWTGHRLGSLRPVQPTPTGRRAHFLSPPKPCPNPFPNSSGHGATGAWGHWATGARPPACRIGLPPVPSSPPQPRGVLTSIHHILLGRTKRKGPDPHPLPQPSPQPLRPRAAGAALLPDRAAARAHTTPAVSWVQRPACMSAAGATRRMHTFPGGAVITQGKGQCRRGSPSMRPVDCSAGAAPLQASTVPPACQAIRPPSARPPAPSLRPVQPTPAERRAHFLPPPPYPNPCPPPP
jgi:hypothetical protein